MKLKYVLFLLLLVTIVTGVYLFNNSDSSVSMASNRKLNQSYIPTPSPVPFYDMTIPYLQSRKYISQLGKLEQIGISDNYTSYLTSYKSDNLTINALLTKPSEEQPKGGWPAIVFVHGYIPPNQYITTERYVDYVDSLARNGFVVIKIDLRGHGGSDGQPGGGYYSPDYVIDTLNAYAALQSSGFVNKNKIGLWGHSMAGNTIARALAVKPEIPVAVIWAGAGYSYIDLSTYGLSDASYQPQPSDRIRQSKRQKLRELYGDPKDGNPFWKTVAATGYLNNLKGAIQLHHAVDDPTVNINYSRDFNSALNLTKVPHELYEYPDGGHNISGYSFSLAMQRTIDFYKKYISDSSSR